MQMKPGVETLCFSLSGEFGELRAEWVNAALLPWYQSEEMKILSNNFYYSRVAIEPPTISLQLHACFPAPRRSQYLYIVTGNDLANISIGFPES